MKMAIPHWQNQISPVLDVAGALLIVEFKATEIVSRTNIKVERRNFRLLVELLEAEGVKLVICGAVSKPLERTLLSSGIEVIAQTRGEINEVLEAYIEGRLKEKMYLMPGSERCRTCFKEDFLHHL